jgi:L-fuconolactonase
VIVDAHAHIVSADLERYRPDPLSGSLGPRDLDDPITAERLLRWLDENDVERAVVVQRAHIYGYDNSYVVDAAARYPDRLSALCMIDALDRQAPQQIRHWVCDRGAIGIRMTEPHRGADPSWFASPTASAAWETAAELGIPVRLHLYRWNREACLPAIVPLVRRFPGTTVVIDHLSNLAAEQGPPDHGLDAPLAALAGYRNVLLLFSTINLAKLVAQGLPAAPVIARLARTFGTGRLLWGSDIGQSQGRYDEMCRLAEAAVALLDDDARERLLGANAHVVYGPIATR